MRLTPLVDADGGGGAKFVGHSVADQRIHCVALREQNAALMLANLGDLFDWPEESVEHCVAEDIDLVSSVQSDQQQCELVFGYKLIQQQNKYHHISIL